MCGVCGCSDVSHNVHDHTHDQHDHASHQASLIEIERNVFDQNNQFALQNKKALLDKKVVMLNIMSSPGAGKTTLLAKTIADLKNKFEIAVIVGDQQMSFDAELIESSGGQAVQVNTGRVCHLDAHMISHAIERVSLKEKSILIVENVGNLICPALFDLGESYRIVALSVTEGDNKPLKYPDMFRSADLMIITKTDLLPYVEFDMDRCIENANRIKPNIETITLTSKNNNGIDAWYQWLEKKLDQVTCMPVRQ